MKDINSSLDIISSEDKEKLHKKLSDFEKNLNERKEEITKIIKEYPLTSVIIAAGIGYLIGKIFQKK